MTDHWVAALQGALALAMTMATVAHRKRPRTRVDPALCDAASTGDLRRVKELLAAGVTPDSADEEGVTALMAAVFAAQVKVVRTLLKAGADPDRQDVSGLTALMNAVIANGEMDFDGAHPVFLEIVELLLVMGADVVLEDQDGCTALDYASSYDLVDLVTLLESAGHP